MGVIWVTFAVLRTTAKLEGDCVKERPIVQPGSYFEAAALSALDLFQDLPDSCLRAIEEASTVRDFRTGHTFFRMGETGEVLFILESAGGIW